MHATVDDVDFYDGLEVQKPCTNSTWIAELIYGFLPVKTWLFIACGTAFICHHDILLLFEAFFQSFQVTK